LDSSQQPNTTCAMHLIWPLFTVAMVSKGMAPWAIRRLEYLGRTWGLGQAIMIAKSLREAGMIFMYKPHIKTIPSGIDENELGSEMEMKNSDAPGADYQFLVRNSS